MNCQLSKTDFILGLSCPKYLWLKYHQPEQMRKTTVAEEFTINEGIQVGELAKKLFPLGIDISIENISENIQQTRELLKKKKPLFEAGFEFENYYARVDILVPNGNKWDLIEVKSGNRVKTKHRYDVAFQKFIIESNGLEIKNCYLLHLNSAYVRKVKIKLEKLFEKENITAEVDSLVCEVKKHTSELTSILSSKEQPVARILLDEKILKKSNHDCLADGCLELEENNVFRLYGQKQEARKLFKSGIERIKDIPDGYPLPTKQQIQRVCEIKETHIEKAEIIAFLKTLQYPLYYLDFETFSTAIPMFDGLGPHAKIPFQFSLHIVKKKGGKPEHYEYLYDGKGDPREEFLQELMKVLGDIGSIVVYHKSFEIGRLQELAELFPKTVGWVSTIIDRIVDLRDPFRKFNYYNRKQQGSASIKAVLPAITGKSYKHLEIRDGRTASVEFYRITYGDCSTEEKQMIRKQLLSYCELDTMAQVLIVKKLIEIGDFI